MIGAYIQVREIFYLFCPYYEFDYDIFSGLCIGNIIRRSENLLINPFKKMMICSELLLQKIRN